MRKKFCVKGMSCASCVSHVEKAVAKLGNSENINVSLFNNTLELDTDILTDEEIMKAVKKAGYKINKIEDNSYNKTSNSKKIKLIISVVFLILLLYVAMGSMIGLPLPSFISGMDHILAFAFTQIILLIPIVVLNFNYFSSGYSKLFRGNPNMDTLVAVGATASILYGFFAITMIIIALNNNDMATVHKYHMDLYFESAGTILTLVSVGKYIEAKSKGKTSDSIKMLLDLSGKTAIRVDQGFSNEQEIKVEEIKIDDLIKVGAGQIVPVDGIIIKGEGSFDESSVTGESIPVHKETSDKVISGSINTDGIVYFKATSTTTTSTIAQIVNLVEEAASSKAPIARLADKISGKFVPVVMILSVITFIIWIICSKDLELSLSIGISVLVVSCPCALGLATPIAIMISTGVAAKNHILIKDAKSLEALHNIDTIVLDKTGTITSGKLSIKSVNEYDSLFLPVLGSLEKASSHPIAKAINNYIEENNIVLKDVENFLTVPGLGVEGVVDGKKYYAGNKKYIQDKIKGLSLDIESYLGIVIVASKEKVLGYITISDTIKESSIEAIENFKRQGIKTIMLTGDNKNSANYVKELAHVDEVIAEVMPDEKGNVIKELKKDHFVLMIGDGINDAVALEEANVAMAIGSGSDIAIESADIILVKNDLMDAFTAYELSKKTIKNIKMSLFWAFFYNVICIPIACGILYPFFEIKFNPMLASLAMSLSSVCVVLNALRLFNFRKRGTK